ncbi:hypothetical protein BZG02_07795 [Labilibaculum filiforme]|uniref:Uncharacterized protein n=1 Tax=Labilibaculum filiforme TaxID=1940526 RepID=A0A2N3I0T0_9BACT|nr:protein-disulfide reductase DsbD family protein [Labilibaculum filiforme]PKQ63904.1 hypothetical protein BZG02_07795 [Labilibaculum filiforme]
MKNALRLFVLIIYLYGGNNAIAQIDKIDSDLEMMVEMEQMDLVTSKPTAMDPLSYNAKVVWSENKDQLAIVLKADLLNNWQIYAYASDASAYITTEIRFEAPKGLEPIGDWQKPIAKPYSEGVEIFKGEIFFVRYYKVVDGVKFVKPIKCGLYYQACDPNQCFPPKTKTVDLQF